MERSNSSAGAAGDDPSSIDYDHILWRDLDLNALYPLTMGFMLSVNVLTYPLNLIKTRMQAPASQLATAPAATAAAMPSAVAAATSPAAVRPPVPPAPSTLQQLRSILASDGVRGLYHGFSLRLGGVLISPIYLTTLETTRQALTEAWGPSSESLPSSPPSSPSPSSSSSPLSSPRVSRYVSSPAASSSPSSFLFLVPSIPFLSGLSAALVSQSLFVPLDVLMQHKQVSRQMQSRSVWQTAQELVRREGLGGLWRGYALAITYFAPFTTIMWGSYAHLHAALRRRFAFVPASPPPAPALPAAASPQPPPSPRNRWTGFERELVMVPVSGSLSSLLAALLCHPLDVLKTRWQLWDTAVQRQPPSFRAVLQQLRQERGLASGLWVGLNAKLMGVAPTSAMAMTCYELAKRLSLREEAEQRLPSSTQYN